MRITEKVENGFYELKKGQEIYGEENGIRLVQIVGQLEDIKDELGIDSITLSKILLNGCWAKIEYEEPKFYPSRLIRICKFPNELGEVYIFFTYGISTKVLYKTKDNIVDYYSQVAIGREECICFPLKEYGLKETENDEVGFALTKEELIHEKII